MKSKAISLLSYLQKPQCLWIPLYQRYFNWKEKQFSDLYEDIKSLIDESVDTHYLGPVILLEKEKEPLGNTLAGKKYKTMEIIDGQQRVTTITIFILIILHLSGKYMLNPEIKNNLEEAIKIFEQNLGAKKLQLHTNDDVDLQNLFDASPKKVTSKAIEKCWTYFERAISEDLNEDLNFLDKIGKSLEKLIVVIIEIEEKDDPQTIYDRINTTALPLSNFDKIKNYIFLAYDRKEQEELKKYFDPIVRVLQIQSDTAKADSFLRYFHIADTATIRKDLYLAFKENISKPDLRNLAKTTLFLETFSEYSFIYGKYFLFHPNPEHIMSSILKKDFLYKDEISEDIYNLLNLYRIFKFFNLYPLVLKTLHKYHKKELSKEITIQELLYYFKLGINIVLNKGDRYKDTNKVTFSILTDGKISLPPSAQRVHNLDAFYNTRHDLLLLKLVQKAYENNPEATVVIKDSIQKVESLKANDYCFLKSEMFELFENFLKKETQIIPNLATRIEFFSFNNPTLPTNKKPFLSAIHGHLFEVFAWNQLKFEILKIVFESNEILWDNLKTNETLHYGNYAYISLREERFNSNYIAEMIREKPVYFSAKAQSSQDILFLVRDLLIRANKPGWVLCM